MIIQLVNILAGVLLCASYINQKVTHQTVAQAMRSIGLYQAEIGIITLIIGIIALLQRLGLFFGFYIGASFPQALPAMAAGLLLGYPLIKQFGFIEPAVRALEPYREIIGVIAILAGLGSLLFGCISPIGCPGGMMYYHF